MVYKEDNSLVREFGGEKLIIEPYGKNSLRIRITHRCEFISESWALLPQAIVKADITVFNAEKEKHGIRANTAEHINDNSAQIKNGKIKAIITKNGKLSFEKSDGSVLLQEFEADRNSCLGINSRELKLISGDSYKASLKFKSNPQEKLYGMGQYQNGIFNLKGAVLELAQRNSQASVPFLYSSLGYGFFWNNPAVGKASFGTNITEWEAYSTKQLEFWITCGDSPAEILESYSSVTGRPPMMPEHGMGFWQCKLRYYSQTQVMNVVRKYKRLGIPLDVIVIDFFHWKTEGDWSFDRIYWPDPKGMVKKINDMGTKVMVSVWPTVSVNAENYKTMSELGYLVKSENGVKIQMLMIDPTVFTDVTNPKAREYMWSKIKENYCRYGIYDFWLDVAEPEFSSYDFENYGYYKGGALSVGNEYPAMYAKTFYDGLKAEGRDEIISLVRCAWAGSQRYGALVWSGDVPSTFESLKYQIICGLQMAIAGIPWWNTDIGGFAGGDIHDEKFKELLVRWFQFGTFCPVMRLHGNRQPGKSVPGIGGGARCGTGAANEIWSFGDENFEIFKKYINIRQKLRPYIRRIMKLSSETGSPVMRPLFYEFYNDNNTWGIADEFMFGDEILVAPVTEYGARTKDCYLPDGCEWVNAATGKKYKGGQTISCDAPLDVIPLFYKYGGTLTGKELK